MMKTVKINEPGLSEPALCVCTEIMGHLEEVQELLVPRHYKPSPGCLLAGDWASDYYIWPKHVESYDGLLEDDPVLMSTDTKYWSIHDVQRYYLGELHCEQILFTYQYPNLHLPTKLGRYLWKANTALKLPKQLYLKEFHSSLEMTLKKIEADQRQINRLLICDQLIKLERLDYFRRKTFMRILLNILSFQNDLKMLSLENLCATRVEGARLIQQIACFNAKSLHYLFLWGFVQTNENPLLINYSYITDDEKTRLAKLLGNMEVIETKLPERCNDLIKEFHNKFGQVVDEEEDLNMSAEQDYENPYKVDSTILKENERKLKDLLAENKRARKQPPTNIALNNDDDPKRPWRTNTSKEKLLRIDNELKRHHERGDEVILPLPDAEMKALVKQCLDENESTLPVTGHQLLESLNEAKRNLPNFKYKTLENSTATAILGDAHQSPDLQDSNKQHNILGVLKNLKILALEYSHLADGTGAAILSLLPVMKKPHFRLQLVCREQQTPGRADAAIGVGGYKIPESAWRKISVCCPDLYLLLAFVRVRDYDYVIRFLSESMPLCEFHLQLGIDLKQTQRQDSDISCIIRLLAYRYSNTLRTLSIHQWRFAMFPLRRVFECMPQLIRFYYTGRVNDEVDLRRMLNFIACGVCDKLKKLKIQIQTEESKNDYWNKCVASLTEEYSEVMRLYGVDFSLNIYKS